MNRKHANAREDYHGIRVGVLAAGPTTGVIGGAERLYSGLVSGLEQIGCKAELVSIPADEPNFDAIMDNYERCAQLDVSRFDVVISTKAPTYAVEHPCHVLYLVHTVRVFDDMFSRVFPDAGGETYIQRARIHARDFEAMQQVKARFAIGHEVAGRLYRWRGLRTQVVHPPLGVSGFRCGPAGDYFFLPGRLHDWKRVHLVIEAVRRSDLPMRLLIAGKGEAEPYLRELAAGDSRIEFLGRVDDDTLIDLYAGALAVPFVPEREDYGYVTLEAFASGKPVVTCLDSGEPARIVVDGVSGRVCLPDPDAIREALEFLFKNPRCAEEMGQQGLAWTAGMSWTDVACRLVDAALAPEADTEPRKLQVAVLDMQPIDPPVGGGRLRLMGLYHNLGERIDCTYVGSYDWPGESFRRHRLSPGLEEIDIPLSDTHHAEAARLSAQAGGKTVIDIAFGRQGHLSPDYVLAARVAVRSADVVVFSHPWVYPLLEGDLQAGQTIVYDSQNVEGFLRAQLLDESNPVEAELLRGVVEDELRLCRRADLILVCSQEDALRFNRLYRIHADKLRVVPNGVMAFSYSVPQAADRFASRRKLKIDGWSLIAIFIGSAYGPNVEAARFIADQLATVLPDILFVVAGGVGSQLDVAGGNLRVTGPLDEAEKLMWLTAADVAVNPMFSGSGTNIKMFDFMAQGLPVVTTEVGARGIQANVHEAFVVVPPTVDGFAAGLKKLQSNSVRECMGRAARSYLEKRFAWERISPITGRLMASSSLFAQQSLPFFSVLVSPRSNVDYFERFVGCLAKQQERDFELVIVDRSDQPWANEGIGRGFPTTYFHAPYMGSGEAWKTALGLANGEFLVLLDAGDAPVEGYLLDIRHALIDSAPGGVSAIALMPPDGEAAGVALPGMVVRMEAMRLVDGFEDVGVLDLKGVETLGTRLQKMGPVREISWLGRGRGIVENISHTVVVLTTLGHKCGIGEYTASLLHALETNGWATHVLTCRSETTGDPAPGGGRPRFIGWHYDDRAYSDSWIYPESASFARALNATLIVIQYHPAFFSVAELERFTLTCLQGRRKVIIDNHRFRAEDAPALQRLVAHGVVLLLHRSGECMEARDLRLSPVLCPLGVENALPAEPRSITDRNWRDKPPVLLTNGFLRAHKGVRTLIAAMPRILAVLPGTVLRVQCAEYPSADSAQELARCRALIEALNLGSQVILDTGFHEKSKMFELMRDGDLALLAYEESDEGGSAAAGDCLSVGLPLIVSDARIFEEVRSYVRTVSGGVDAWAEAVIELLMSPDTYTQLVSDAHAYVMSNDWNKVASRYISVVAD